MPKSIKDCPGCGKEYIGNKDLCPDCEKKHG